MQKGAINPHDLIAFIVILFGALGFFLWGLGIQTPANTTLQWLGGSIVALIAFQRSAKKRFLDQKCLGHFLVLATFLARWFR